MEIVSVIALIVLGLGLIIVEFIWIPGTTIVGVIGFIMTLIGIYLGYQTLGTSTGHVILTSSVVVTGVSLYVAVKKKAWKKFSLEDAITGRVKDRGEDHLVMGQSGMTVSALRPSGQVEFNERQFEVTTLGGFIDSGVKVEIVKLDRNKIIVEQIS